MRRDLEARDAEELSKLVYLNRGNNYRLKYPEEFVDMDTEVTFAHKPPLEYVSHEFIATPFSIINTSLQCTACNEQNYENGKAKIKAWLDKNIFNYEEDVEMEFTEDGVDISFDFVIPYEEDNLYINYLDVGKCSNVTERSSESRAILKLCKEYELNYFEVWHRDFRRMNSILKKSIPEQE